MLVIKDVRKSKDMRDVFQKVHELYRDIFYKLPFFKDTKVVKIDTIAFLVQT